MIERLIISSFALFLLGVSLRMSLRLLYGARGPAPEDSVNLLLRIASWGLIVLPVIVLSISGANWLSLILIAAVLEALFELVLARRAAQRQAVWRLIVGAVGDGRSLVDALGIHQSRFSGIVGRWQRRLLGDLERGVAWQEAVSNNSGAVPRDAPALAAVMTSGAGPGAAVCSLEDWCDPAYQELRQQVGQRFAYLATVCMATVAVVAFVMINVVPSFAAIYADFDLELPAITTSLIALSNAAAKTLGPLILLAVFVTALAALVMAVFYLCDVPVMQRWTDRLTLFRHRAQVMRLLAAAFDQGISVDQALLQLASGRAPYPSALLRRKLEAARRRAAAGDPWQDALRRSSLISSADAAVLRSAQAAGNLPWALRMLAERKVRRATFRWAILQQMAFVVVVLMLGLFVFWYAVAMFVPLVVLIWNLTG